MPSPVSLRRLAAPLTIHVVVAIIAFAGSVYPAGDFDRYWVIQCAGARMRLPLSLIGTVLVFRGLAAAGCARSSASSSCC